MASTDPRDAFDAALIPGMRQRLAEAYARFRAAEATAMAANAPAEFGGRAGAYRDRCCPNCDTPAPKHVLLRAHGIDVVECPVCCLAYSRQVMEETADAARYRVSSFHLEEMRLHCSGPYLELETARARYYLDRLGDNWARARALLEIGCGTGTFLVEAQTRGWEVLGIEPNPMAVAVARERGARVIEGYFPQDLRSDQARFNAIAILDVLEHFADPRAFLRIVRKHLEPEGRLFVQVPNWDSLLVQLEGALSSAVCPGHWSYFTQRTLPDLMLRAGYRTVIVETVISEIDRIAQFSEIERDAVLARLRPTLTGRTRLDHTNIAEATQLHALGLGYKLIGIFRPLR